MTPATEKRFLTYYENPMLAAVMNQLYHVNAPEHNRDDLVAVLLTGIKSPMLNYTGPKLVDELQIILAIDPTPPANVSRLGVLGGDLAGYPNGRRVFDDCVTIEVRAIAGVTIPLVDPSFTPDGAAGVVTDFKTSQLGSSVPGPHRYIDTFPYLGTPLSGFDVPS